MRHYTCAPSFRPASVWRIFGTVWRRPMATTTASRHNRISTGGFGVIIEIPYPDRRTEGRRMTIRTILVDDEPLAIQGLQLRLAAARRCRDHRHLLERPRGDPRDQDPQARSRLPRHPDARLRRLLGGPGADGGRAAAVRLRHRLFGPCDPRLRGAGGRLSDEAGRRGAARRHARPRPPAPGREARRRGSRAAEGSARRSRARCGRECRRRPMRRATPRTASRS